MRPEFALLLAAVLAVGCAGKGNVIETHGTASLEKSQVAVLETPLDLTILAIDGKIPEKHEYAQEYLVRLRPGRHRISIAYESDWGRNAQGGSYNQIYSRDFVEIDFNVVAGEDYYMEYPVPRNEKQAEEFARKLEVSIVDASGNQRFDSVKAGKYGPPANRAIRGFDAEVVAAGTALTAGAAAAGSEDSSSNGSAAAAATGAAVGVAAGTAAATTSAAGSAASGTATTAADAIPSAATPDKSRLSVPSTDTIDAAGAAAVGATVAVAANSTDQSGAVNSTDQAEALIAQQDALERLQLWWKLASDEERKAFRTWIISNE